MDQSWRSVAGDVGGKIAEESLQFTHLDQELNLYPVTLLGEALIIEEDIVPILMTELRLRKEQFPTMRRINACGPGRSLGARPALLGRLFITMGATVLSVSAPLCNAMPQLLLVIDGVYILSPWI